MVYGLNSRLVGEGFRDWIPKVLQTVEPYVSSQDIHPGSLWFQNIAAELRSARFAIICVTPENASSPWLHFEAGAIGMAQHTDVTGPPTSVVPYLVGLEKSDLKPPMSKYQAELGHFES